MKSTLSIAIRTLIACLVGFAAMSAILYFYDRSPVPDKGPVDQAVHGSANKALDQNSGAESSRLPKMTTEKRTIIATLPDQSDAPLASPSVPKTDHSPVTEADFSSRSNEEQPPISPIIIDLRSTPKSQDTRKTQSEDDSRITDQENIVIEKIETLIRDNSPPAAHRKISHLEGNIEVDLRDVTLEATDLILDLLPTLTHIDTLHIDFNKISDSGEANLRRLPSLQKLTKLTLRAWKVNDDRMKRLRGLVNLVGLTIDYSNDQLSDAGLEYLKFLRNLKGLTIGQEMRARGDLTTKSITGQGLVYLRALPKLEYLSLAHNAITDSGLAFLEGCPKLQSLILSGNRITDFGLVYLEGLPNLQWLDLSSNPITDSGLVHLKGLTRLSNYPRTGGTPFAGRSL